MPSWVETLAAPSLSAVRGHKGKLQLKIPPCFAKQNSHPITGAHLNELLWRIPFACTWKGFWWLQNKSTYIYMSRQGAIWIICENVASFMKIEIPCHKGCHPFLCNLGCLFVEEKHVVWPDWKSQGFTCQSPRSPNIRVYSVALCIRKI